MQCTHTVAGLGVLPPLVIKLLNEGVEFPLLLQDVGAGGPGELLFQSQVHSFVTPVLLRMPGLNALEIVMPSRSHQTESVES